MKNRAILERMSPSETVIFGPCNFVKRSFSEILDQCDFGKNGVCQKNLDRLLLSKNTWTSAILERMESYKKFRKAYYLIYLVQTILGESGPERFQKELILHSIPTFEMLNKTFQQSLHIIFVKQHLFSLIKFFLF
jgi:hypothetical protein